MKLKYKFGLLFGLILSVFFAPAEPRPFWSFVNLLKPAIASEWDDEISDEEVINAIKSVPQHYAVTTQFQACASATGGFEFWTGTGGAVSFDTTVKRSPGSQGTWKLDTSNPAANVSAQKSNIITDAGARISFWVNFPSVTPAVAFSIFSTLNATLGNIIQVTLLTTGKLRFDAVGAGSANGTTVLSPNTWYRISVSYTITSATVFSMSLFINGNLEATRNNTGTLTNINTAHARILILGTAGTSFTGNFDEVYIDNGVDLADPAPAGKQRGVTAKRSASTNTGNWDTTIGTGAVNEVPISLTNGMQHAGVTSKQQNYTLQTASVGDVDISEATIVARTAWIWAKRGAASPGALAAHANNTGSTTGTTLTLGPVAVAVGQLMVANFTDRVGGATPTIADDSDANAWTTLSGPTTSTVRHTKWFKVCATDKTSCTVTITFGSSSAKRAGALGIFNSPTASPLDINATDTTGATTPYTCPATGTLAQASELVFGFVGNASTGTYTAISPNLIVDTAATTGNSSSSVGLGYQVVSSTSTVSPAFAGTSAAGVQGTASFKLGTGIGTPKIMDNGTETAVTLTTSAALYTVITDSSTYPSDAAGIGMRSSGDGADTFLYECGTIISYDYIPLVTAMTPTVTGGPKPITPWFYDGEIPQMPKIYPQVNIFTVNVVNGGSIPLFSQAFEYSQSEIIVRGLENLFSQAFMYESGRVLIEGTINSFSDGNLSNSGHLIGDGAIGIQTTAFQYETGRLIARGIENNLFGEVFIYENAHLIADGKENLFNQAFIFENGEIFVHGTINVFSDGNLSNTGHIIVDGTIGIQAISSEVNFGRLIARGIENNLFSNAFIYEGGHLLARGIKNIFSQSFITELGHIIADGQLSAFGLNLTNISGRNIVEGQINSFAIGLNSFGSHSIFDSNQLGIFGLTEINQTGRLLADGTENLFSDSYLTEVGHLIADGILGPFGIAIITPQGTVFTPNTSQFFPFGITSGGFSGRILADGQINSWSTGLTNLFGQSFVHGQMGIFGISSESLFGRLIGRSQENLLGLGFISESGHLIAQGKLDYFGVSSISENSTRLVIGFSNLSSQTSDAFGGHLLAENGIHVSSLSSVNEISHILADGKTNYQATSNVNELGRILADGTVHFNGFVFVDENGHLIADGQLDSFAISLFNPRGGKLFFLQSQLSCLSSNYNVGHLIARSEITANSYNQVNSYGRVLAEGKFSSQNNSSNFNFGHLLANGTQTIFGIAESSLDAIELPWGSAKARGDFSLTISTIGTSSLTISQHETFTETVSQIGTFNETISEKELFNKPISTQEEIDGVI